MPDSLAGFPVTVRVTVLWGELDAYGHLNNVVLFRFFEEARIAYLERCGFLASYAEQKIGVILHSTSCRFRRPVFHPDTIEVGTRVTDVQEDRFTMEYVARSVTQDEVVAEGSAIVVCYDYTKNAKAPIPKDIRTAISNLRG